MIVNLFKEREEVFEQGFIVYSSLLEKFKERMEQYTEDFYTYISHALG